MISGALFVAACAFLYRWGGGPILGIPCGWKAARRYLLPLLIAFYSGAWIPMAAFCLIAHFNLSEIAARRWEEIALYGFGQAWCFAVSGAGLASGFLAAWWIFGVYWSNVGLPDFAHDENGKFSFTPTVYKIDWFYVELIHGLLIGLICLL